MTIRNPFGLLSGAAVIIGAVGAFALGAEPTKAQVAAKVESQTRPNFGVLLDPPTRRTYAPRRDRNR